MFNWNVRKAQSNFEKHGVSFEEAATVFADPRGIDITDQGHSDDEDRFFRIGASIEERILVLRLHHSEA